MPVESLHTADAVDDVPHGSVAIKKRSRVPGVMITQYVEKLPLGKSTPDFMRKPFAVTLQQGKTATFKAVVTGDPEPVVTWACNKGDITDPEKYKTRYNKREREHILEIPNVRAAQADTYKCIATNSFGRAVCSTILKVIDVGLKKNKPEPIQNDPEDFRKMLKKTVVVKKQQEKPKKEGEIDPQFWDVLLSAQKKDYEHICRNYGITDFRWILKRLNQMKKEIEDKQAKVVEDVKNFKHIEVNPNGNAEFELDMKLKDPNSKINLYKDGKIIDYGDGTDHSVKHNMTNNCNKYKFSISNVGPEDAGLYQVDVEDTNVFSTGLEIPDVEIGGLLKDAKVVEGQDATFECVLSAPLKNLSWYNGDTFIENADKYNIKVSEDMLTHSLVVKNCTPKDKGIYTVVAGTKISKAALSVNDDPNAHLKVDHGNRLIQKQDLQQQETDEMTKKGFKTGASETAGADGSGGSNLTDGASGDGTNGEGCEQNGKGIDTMGTLGSGRNDKSKGEGLLGDGSENIELSGEGVEKGLDLTGKGGEGTDGNKSSDDGTGEIKRKNRTRDSPLVPDTIKEPEAHFLSGLSDTSANVGKTVELSCTLSSEDIVGIWYKDGKRLESNDGISIVKDGETHKLIIKNCQEENAGTYRFEASGRKSEATLSITDPPNIDADALGKFSEPVIVKAGENAVFKLPFSGKEPLKVQWFKNDDELLDGSNVKTESSFTQSRLLLTKCQRKDTGEVKIKIKNEFATIEATSKLIVLDKPAPPQGPVEVVESSLSAIEFKWRPPKDDGGCPITNYNLERQQLGRNTWTKIGDIKGEPTYRDTNIDRGRKYCYRIRAKNSEGLSDMMVTDEIAAGMLAFPGQPACPKVIGAFRECINLSWIPPPNTGGGKILGYNIEKRKKGSNLWSQVNPKNEPIQGKKYAVKDVMEGVEYEFRVIAINACGPGEPSAPSDAVFARDPQKTPGTVKDLKLTGSSYTSLCLAWNKPNVVKGVEDEAQGYFVEIRPLDQLDWSRCNINATIKTSFTVAGLKSLAKYWVRVIATNQGGEGIPQGFDNYVIAMPPPVKPKFTDRKMKNFMVVKAGDTVRASIRFEASPFPDITWLKDSVPVSKHVTVTNSDKSSQLLITTSERSDSGLYTIIVKNIVGQGIFSIEIRVTDNPKPPGPVQLEQNVKDTVTLSWIPSTDEKLDARLCYMVMKRDSVKQTWRMVADNLFNHKLTVNIIQGREYYFRVFAKNDMGLSEPSVSPTWGTVKKKEVLQINQSESKDLNFQSAPRFTVPLKLHTAPNGYECYMSCAVRGNPAPRITWYHNNVSLNTDTNYYISNTCGVCSLLILMVGPQNTGEYKVLAESSLGQAESSTNLTVRE